MSRVLFRAALAALASFALAGASRAVEAPDVRLGRDVVPVFQAVRLRLDADKRNYSGSTRTELRVAVPTRMVRLHAEGQSLKRVTLRQGGDSVHVTVEKAIAACSR
jgi:hypothetical protein